MLLLLVATVDASAAGTCQPVVVNAGAGMVAVAVDAEDGGTRCRGWGPSRPSTLELGAGHDCQRWGWRLLRQSTLGIGGHPTVNAGDGGSTVVTNTGAVKKKNTT